MMNIFITHTNFEYTRMTAAGWAVGSCGGEGGPTIFEGVACRLLADKLKQIEAPRFLVVNCNDIRVIDEHALIGLSDLIKVGHMALLFFDNAHRNLEKECKTQIDGPNASFELDNGYIVIAFGFNNVTSEFVKDVVSDSVKLEKDKLKSIVKFSWKPFVTPERLSSTPLIANGVFNARSIISDPSKLLWIGIFMADRVKEVIQKYKISSHCLLAVSLRGSPIAAAAWFLSSSLATRIEIVDHIGPIHEILEEPIYTNEKSTVNYIYIGDFIVGGTELKAAKLYAWSKGKRLEHAIVIGAVLHSGDYDSSGRLKLEQLLNLQECDITLKYDFL